MSKVFEDEFMDVQTGLISLCLEVTEDAVAKVDKVYAYCYNNKYSVMFNAFFVVNGQVKTLDKLDIPDDLAFEFLGYGIEDLESLQKICEKYNKPVPVEMKLYYDVTTGKFNADYKYEEVCLDKSAGEVFMEWLEEIKGS